MGAYPVEKTVEAVLKWNMGLPMEQHELALALSVYLGRKRPLSKSRVGFIERTAKKKIRAAFERRA